MDNEALVTVNVALVAGGALEVAEAPMLASVLGRQGNQKGRFLADALGH